MITEIVSYDTFLRRLNVDSKYPEYSPRFHTALARALFEIGTTSITLRGDVALSTLDDGRLLAMQKNPWTGFWAILHTDFSAMPILPLTSAELAEVVDSMLPVVRAADQGAVIQTNAFYTLYDGSDRINKVIYRENPIVVRVGDGTSTDWLASLTSEARRRLRVRCVPLEEKGFTFRLVPGVPMDEEHVAFIREATFKNYPDTYLLSIGQYAHSHAYAVVYGEDRVYTAEVRDSSNGIVALATFPIRHDRSMLLQSFTAKDISNIGVFVLRETVALVLDTMPNVDCIDMSFGYDVKVPEFGSYKKSVCNSSVYAETICATDDAIIGAPVLRSDGWLVVQETTYVTGYGDFVCK